MDPSSQPKPCSQSNAAMLAAWSVRRLLPQIGLLGAGPCSMGFFVEFSFEGKLPETFLSLIGEEMEKLKREERAIRPMEMVTSNAQAFLRDKGFPSLAEGLEEHLEPAVQLFSSDDFLGICPHPLWEDSSFLELFRLVSLQELETGIFRLEGRTFSSKEDWKAFPKVLKEQKKWDHLRLGEQMKLFSFSSTSHCPLWKDRGVRLREKIWSAWADLRDQNHIPVLLDGEPGASQDFFSESKKELLKEKKFNFLFSEQLSLEEGISEPSLGLKACPHFQQGRVISCHPASNRRASLFSALQIILRMHKMFGLRTRIHFAKRSPGALGTQKEWRAWEATVKEILSKEGLCPELDREGELAYGPGLGFFFEDHLGRKSLGSIVQSNLALVRSLSSTEKLDVLAWAAIASMESWIAKLLEDGKGEFPLWCEPYLALLLPLEERHEKEALALSRKMEALGLRVQVDRQWEQALSSRIRRGQMERFPYLLVLGDRELEGGEIRLRCRDGREKLQESLQSWVEVLERRVEESKRKPETG